jgi:hypothetical protein
MKKFALIGSVVALMPLLAGRLPEMPSRDSIGVEHNQRVIQQKSEDKNGVSRKSIFERVADKHYTLRWMYDHPKTTIALTLATMGILYNVSNRYGIGWSKSPISPVMAAASSSLVGKSTSIQNIPKDDLDVICGWFAWLHKCAFNDKWSAYNGSALKMSTALTRHWQVISPRLQQALGQHWKQEWSSPAAFIQFVHACNNRSLSGFTSAFETLSKMSHETPKS